jgi:hypothetical protein
MRDVVATIAFPYFNGATGDRVELHRGDRVKVRDLRAQGIDVGTIATWVRAGLVQPADV